MKLNMPVTQREVAYRDNAIIISKTDRKGVITEINADFLEISGFNKEELLGKSHNMVRHPDMPPAAFEDLWQTVKQGKLWNGIVKNRCKNGDYYWVEANVTPTLQNGEIVGYVSVRTKPSRQQIQQAEKLYIDLKAGKKHRLQALLTNLGNLRIRTKLGLSLGILCMAPALTATFGFSAYVAAAINLGLACAMLPLLCSVIGAPLNALREVMMVIQNSGDLSRRVPVRADDEIGQATKAFNALILTLRGITREVKTGVDNISRATQAMSAATEQVKHNVEAQNEAALSGASAVEEMSASIASVADSTSTVRADAHTSLESTQSGNKNIASVVSGINTIEQIVNTMANSVGEFVASTRKITQMTKQVRDIADQTNLLALNAAIEAARAGELGRGFAVVADEVRKLAEKSACSAREIDEITQSIEKQSSSAEQSITAGLEHLGQMQQTMDAFAQSIADSVSSVMRATHGVDSIQGATQEQAIASSILSRDMARIAEMCEASTRAVQQTFDSTQELKAMESNLQEAIGRFRT